MPADKNGKVFGKISLIDIGIALLVIVCAAGIYLRFAGGISELTAQSVEIEYVYEVKQIRQTSVEALAKKGNFYNKAAGQDYMGTITDVKAVPNEDSSTLVNGRIVKTSAPERFDALVTVRVRGKQTANAIYTASNQPVEAGSHVYLTSKWAACEGDIKSVKILD